jgi:hypothetical protein
MPGFRGIFRSDQYYFHDRKPCVKYFRKNSLMACRIHNVSFIRLFALHCKCRILPLGFLDMLIIFFVKGTSIPFARSRSKIGDDETGRT